MKTVGIIGGLGPETTAEFYLELISLAFKNNKLQRPPILIWNVPLLYQIEEDLITKSTGEGRFIPFLVEAAEHLEKGGADFIVIPCNTVHLFIEEVRKSVKIPVLSIIEETAAFLKQKNINEVAMLATETTIQKGIYWNTLDKNNIWHIVPDKVDQQKIGEIINNLVNSNHFKSDREEFQKIITKCKDTGVTTALLACTDLQLLKPEVPGMQIFDTMKILAEATVKRLL